MNDPLCDVGMSTRKLQPHEMLNHSHDIQLCDLVSRNPCLYDTSLPEYKEAAVRERAWEDIAADINVPSEFIIITLLQLLYQ